MGILDKLIEKAKSDKKTIVLPETMDKRTFEAAEKVLKEGIADIILIGAKEEIEDSFFEYSNEGLKRIVEYLNHIHKERFSR